jgi:hypothetical protein
MDSFRRLARKDMIGGHNQPQIPTHSVCTDGLFRGSFTALHKLCTCEAPYPTRFRSGGRIAGSSNKLLALICPERALFEVRA